MSLLHADPVEATLRRVAQRAWTIAEPIPCDEWAERFFIGAELTSDERTRIDYRRAPYFREVLRAFSDPGVRRIAMQWGAQLAKTLLLEVMIGYTIDVAPYPSMLVASSRDVVQDLVTGKLMPAVASTPALSRHRLGDPNAEQQRRLLFDSMVMYLAGANSAGALALKTVGRLFEDEIDKWPAILKGRGGVEGSALSLARKRLAKAEREGYSKEVLSSTPTDEGKGINGEYLTSDQGRWQVPCPSCGVYQALEFEIDSGGGLRWEGGSGRDLDEVARAVLVKRVRANAWYECRSCHKRIESWQKFDMNLRGRWVRHGQEVLPDGTVIGEPPDVETRGFRLSALDSNEYTFGDVAADFIEGGGEITRTFVNSTLGDVWRDRGERTSEDRLIEIVRINTEAHEAPDYLAGQVPAEALVLTGAIDVQKDEAYYEVVGWGEGERRYLIDWGVVPCPHVPQRKSWDSMTPSEIEQMRALLASRWAHVESNVIPRTYEHLGDRAAWRVTLWAVDSGYNAGDVYRLCERIGPCLVPVKGEPATIGSRKTKVSNWQDFGLLEEMELLLVGTNYWKTEVFQRMQRHAPYPACWYWPRDFADREGRLYARHLTAEHRVASRRYASIPWEWKKKTDTRRNEWLDTSVYNLALATAEGLNQLRAGMVVGGAPYGGDGSGDSGAGLYGGSDPSE